jgi:hypothetical protein
LKKIFIALMILFIFIVSCSTQTTTQSSFTCSDGRKVSDEKNCCVKEGSCYGDQDCCQGYHCEIGIDASSDKCVPIDKKSVGSFCGNDKCEKDEWQFNSCPVDCSTTTTLE